MKLRVGWDFAGADTHSEPKSRLFGLGFSFLDDPLLLCQPTAMRLLQAIFLTSALCQCAPTTKRHTDSTIFIREQAEIREINNDRIGKTLL